MHAVFVYFILMFILYEPLVEPVPDTSVIDKSDLKLIIEEETGISPNKTLTSIPNLFRNREIGMSNYRDGQKAHAFGRSDRCKFSSRFLPNKMQRMEHYPSKGT